MTANHKQSVHANLLLIQQCGVLITGAPGIGKSSTALQLIDRKHTLVSDDCVDIHRQQQQLIGSAPEELSGQLHIRGIGMIDVLQLYSKQSIAKQAAIHLIIELTAERDDTIWITPKKRYKNLLSIDIDYMKISTRSLLPLPLAIETLVAIHYSKKNRSKKGLTHDL